MSQQLRADSVLAWVEDNAGRAELGQEGGEAVLIQPCPPLCDFSQAIPLSLLASTKRGF